MMPPADSFRTEPCACGGFITAAVVAGVVVNLENVYRAHLATRVHRSWRPKGNAYGPAVVVRAAAR